MGSYALGMTLIRQYWVEFGAAVLTALLMLIGTAFRDVRAPRPSPSPRSFVQVQFLVELQTAHSTVTVGPRGELSGRQSLTQTQWVDLRQAVERLRPDSASEGPWKLRFYDAKGAHEVRFDPAQPTPEQKHVLMELRALGLLKE